MRCECAQEIIFIVITKEIVMYRSSGGNCLNNISQTNLIYMYNNIIIFLYIVQ